MGYEKRQILKKKMFLWRDFFEDGQQMSANRVPLLFALRKSVTINWQMRGHDWVLKSNWKPIFLKCSLYSHNHVHDTFCSSKKNSTTRHVMYTSTCNRAKMPGPGKKSIETHVDATVFVQEAADGPKSFLLSGTWPRCFEGYRRSDAAGATIKCHPKETKILLHTVEACWGT